MSNPTLRLISKTNQAEGRRSCHLLTLSAKTPTALREQVKVYQDFLRKNSDISLKDLCFSANTGRAHFDCRFAVLATSLEQLQAKLAAWSLGQPLEGTFSNLEAGPANQAARVAFLLAGQGSQFPNMGKLLYETQPTFRTFLDRCAQLLAPQLAKPLLSVIYPEPGEERATPLHQTAYSQPALFAFEYALAQLWLSWGIVPAAVMGHSVGEYVAACIAGVMSLEDGLRLIAERGRLMQSLPATGMMAAVLASEERVREVLVRQTASQPATIATLNGPQNTVISGRRESVEAVLAVLAAEGIPAKPLRVSHAFHSPLMEPILAEFQAFAESIPWQAPKIPLISNLTGQFWPAGEIPTATYWRQHLREAVRFAAGLTTLQQEGYQTFLEVGPHTTLSGMGQQCLPAAGHLWLPSLERGRDDWDALSSNLAQLYVRGASPHWWAFEGDYPGRRLTLPNYPFQRQRCWTANGAGQLAASQEKSVPAAPVSPTPDESQVPHDWFYVWQWQEAPPEQPRLHPARAVLVLAGEGQVGEELVKLLGGKQEQPVYRVKLGSGFQRQGPDCFQLNPARSEDYEALFACLKAEGVELTDIVHLWHGSHLSPNSASWQESDTWMQASTYSLIFLSQVLRQFYSDNFLYLWLVTENGFATGEGEALQGPHQVMGATLAQVLAQENPYIYTKVIDLDGLKEGAASQALLLQQEMERQPSGDSPLALRQGRRLGRCLQKINPQPPLAPSPGLQAGETWLITGGTSAVAGELALGMARQVPLNLVLTGRQPLPERAAWPQVSSAELRRRLDLILELERLGANVLYCAVDVSDLAGMEQLLAEVAQRFGDLHGIIQGAGSQDTQNFQLHQKTAASVAAVLAPKVRGTIILDRLTRHQPLGYFILLSSATASKGEWASHLGDYAAANAFLDSFAAYRHCQGAPGRTLALNYSLWRERGMTQIGGPSLLRAAQARGLTPLDPPLAVKAFQQALTVATPPVLHLLDWQPVREAAAALHPAQSDSGGDKPKPNLRRLLREILREHLAIAPEQIEGHRTFEELGLESLSGIEVMKQLAETLSQPLSPTLLFQYSTPNDLADYLEQKYRPSPATVTPPPAVSPLQDLSVGVGQPPPGQPAAAGTATGPATGPQASDIAIIGLDCLVPGAENWQQFWQLLREGRSAIGEIPQHRWSRADYFDPQAQTAHTSYCQYGGFVEGVYDFEPMFFGLSPREASAMDPQQRLFLEVAWRALQQAGYGGRARPEKVGVFVGCGLNSYAEHFTNYQYYEVLRRHFQESEWFKTLPAAARRQLAATLHQVLQPSEILPETAAGNELNEIAARVSHCLDLTGPSLAVSTACSSSLVALHYACEQLRSGQIEMAIAGGVSLNLSQTAFTFLSRVQALSPTGTCHPFDSRANGLVLGEGAGAVILKPLPQALADGDCIRAVIKGSAVNNDGHTQGITAPNPRGQAAAIRQAYQQWGITPESVSYVESHGTGTLLGDPIEVEGLTQAFRSWTERRGFCGLGSVKSSIGHLLSASGIISLLKVVLSMEQGQIPPTLGFQEANPHINFADTPFYVVAGEGQAWTTDGSPLRAGVNGFGFGGTNCHVILEQAPRLPAPAGEEREGESPYLLMLNARTLPSLKQIARQLQDWLGQQPELRVRDIAFTLSKSQRELAYKAVGVVSNRQELLTALAAIEQEQPAANLHLGRSHPQRSQPLYLLFDGKCPFSPEAAQVLAAHFPPFARGYQACLQQWQQATSREGEAAGAPLSATVSSFAQQYGLAQLLISLKLQPTCLLTEGSGILVGACLSGGLSLEMAMTLLARLAGRKMVYPPASAASATPAWDCPLLTPSGSIQYPLTLTNLQLGALVQNSGQLPAAQVQAGETEGGIYWHLGGDASWQQRWQVEDGRWQSLAAETETETETETGMPSRLLSALARLAAAGVHFQAASLFPSQVKCVLLPSYPFQRKTYQAPPVPLAAQLPPLPPLAAGGQFTLSPEERQAHAQRLFKDFGFLSNS